MDYEKSKIGHIKAEIKCSLLLYAAENLPIFTLSGL